MASFLNNEDAWPIVYIIEICLSSLGIAGSIFVLFVFVCYPSLRTWPFELVAYLSLSSTINSFSYILYYFEDPLNLQDEIKCKIQAFIMIWFENSQFIWAMLIGYSIYECIVVFKDEFEVTYCKRIGYLFLGFIIPLGFSLLGFFLDYLGPTGNWCWIGEFTKPPQGMKFSKELKLSTGVRVASGLLISFCIIVILLNWYFIYSTIKSLKIEYQNTEVRLMVKGYINKISLFPLIQTICMFPSIVNKFFLFFQLEFVFLNILQTLFVSSQGCFYALTYGCNTKVKLALKKTVGKLCCRPDLEKSKSFSSDSCNELNNSNRMIEELLDNYPNIMKK